MKLIVLDGTYTIAKLPSDAALPAWAGNGPLFSITRTEDELSVVCLESQVPTWVRKEGGWRSLRVAGTIDFAEVGVLASLASPLAEAGIGLFVISTFDTDYLLVKEADWERTREVLIMAGHSF